MTTYINTYLRDHNDPFTTDDEVGESFGVAFQIEWGVPATHLEPEEPPRAVGVITYNERGEKDSRIGERLRRANVWHHLMQDLIERQDYEQVFYPESLGRLEG